MGFPANPAYLLVDSNKGAPMSLVSVVITLIVVGMLLWLVNSYIPMDGKIKNILNIVVVIAVIGWLLYGFGILGNGDEIRLPKVN
jgi:predicted membrane protein